MENISFVAAYYWSAHHTQDLPVTWFSLGAMVIVVGGTAVGLCSMVLYYRFYHPAGPIYPGIKPQADQDTNESSDTNNVSGNDYVIKSSTYIEEKEAVVPQVLVSKKAKVTNLQPSRSFKQTLRKPPAPAPPPSPPQIRVNAARLPTPMTSPLAVVENLDIGNTSHASPSPSSPNLDDCKTSEKMDSAYGTDSNRTASRNTESSATMFVNTAGKSPSESYSVHMVQNVSQNSSFNPDLSGSNKSNTSAAFNNETYMSIEQSPCPAEEQSYMSVSGPMTPNSNNNTYQSVHPMSESGARSDPNSSQDSQSSKVTVIDQSVQTPKRPRQDLLKRSPVLKDVTNVPTINTSTPSSVKPGSNNANDECCDKGKERLHAPLTIIIPNISNQAFTKSSSQSPDKWSDKTISLDILNPGTCPPDISNLSSHDYENLALVNINRAPLGPLHWRTYSDMANSRHDDSEKYEKSKLNFTSSSEYRYNNIINRNIFIVVSMTAAKGQFNFASLPTA